MELQPGEGQFEVIDTPEEDEGHDFEEVNENRHAAPITIRATSTSNPKRPRTLRAGYEYSTGTLTVIFRDGTWWNYYKVPATMWEGFRNASSKGAYLASSGLDNWPDMGEPVGYSISPQMMQALSKTSQVQKALGGKQSRKVSGPRVEAALNRFMRGLGQR